MLNKTNWGQALDLHEPTIDLAEAIRVLRRRRFVLLSVPALTIAAALLYVITAPVQYTAHSMLLFDVHSSDGLQQPVSINPAADSAYVDSQVEVLKSDAIARSVIKKLNLESDPEFLTPPHPIVSAILGLVYRLMDALTPKASDNRAAIESDRLAPLVASFHSDLTVKRTGLTYVVDVAYRSRDRQKAATIANAVVDAYVVAELDSKYQAAHQAGGWLEDRVKELEAQAQKAERAVAEYKAQNNITDTGRPLTEPELAALSAQRRAALQDIESTAQTYRMLHEAFVQRATQQQSLPSTEARAVSKAVPPTEKSDPKTLLILAAASLLGAVGGVAAAFAREHLSPVFVSPGQLEKELGTRCLGMFPALPKRNPSRSPQRAGGTTKPVPVAGHVVVRQTRDAARRIISRDPHRYTRAIDEPFSAWTESIRFLAAEIMSDTQRLSVIGIGSALAGEGKSMAAANLAQLIADAGRKVLLVDCDLRNPGLTRSLARDAKQGLLDAIANEDAPLDQFVWRDPATGLHFLPAPPAPVQPVHPSRTLSSEPMQKFLARAQKSYDYVILDLPPIAPVADVKAASHLIDSFILIVEWGRTSQSAVLDALNTAPLVAGKLTGAVLNKASPSALQYVESYRTRHHG